VHGVTEEQLRIAVAASRSWRGVLRTLGRTSPRIGRELKGWCDALGIDHSHFGADGRDEVIKAAVMGASTWAEAVEAAGYAPFSGTARATLRKRCAALGIDVSHLAARPGLGRAPLSGDVSPAHLPAAAPMLLAGALTLSGHVVNWPLEPAAYDLLIDSKGSLMRLQVKSTTRRLGSSWLCNLTHSTYDQNLGRSVSDIYTPDQIDAFGIVDGDLSCYLVPLSAVLGKATITTGRCDDFRLPVALTSAAHAGASGSLSADGL
jgi:hypothetical protein